MAKLPMGELEGQVMNMLWSAGEWLTPGDVHEALSSDRKIAYTTVMTVLTRLWQKDRVDRRREGRAYAYFPTASQDEYAAARMNEVLLGAGDHTLALTHFLRSLAPGDRARLRRIVEGRRST